MSGYRIILERVASEEGGGWIASVAVIEGVFSFGRTVDEAVSNVEEVLRLHLKDARATGERVPDPDEHEVGEAIVLSGMVPVPESA